MRTHPGLPGMPRAEIEGRLLDTAELTMAGPDKEGYRDGYEDPDLQ